MKNLRNPGILLLTLLFSAQLRSQEIHRPAEPDTNKPSLFSSFPEKIAVSIPELQSLFTTEAAKGLDLRSSFIDRKLPGFKGQLVSTASKYNNTLKTVVIRSSQFNGATLTLSSSTTTDGAVRYTGRIISFQHGDMYVLQRENEHYYLVRKKLNEVMNE